MSPLLDTIPKIQVDQRLVRDAHIFRLLFEVVNGRTVKIDRDLLFQLLGIGIFTAIQRIDIIFFSHGGTSFVSVLLYLYNNYYISICQEIIIEIFIAVPA